MLLHRRLPVELAGHSRRYFGDSALFGRRRTLDAAPESVETGRFIPTGVQQRMVVTVEKVNRDTCEGASACLCMCHVVSVLS